MEPTTAGDEAAYWLELEGLLARFHHDLQRTIATLVQLGEGELTADLEFASIHIGVACYRAAVKLQGVPAAAS